MIGLFVSPGLFGLGLVHYLAKVYNLRKQVGVDLNTGKYRNQSANQLIIHSTNGP